MSVCIPDLFRQQLPRAGAGFQDVQQPRGFIHVPGGQLVMGAFARQQRPDAPHAGPIERISIGMLAVAIIVVAVPAGPVRQIGLQQGIDHLDRVDHALIIGSPQPKAHQRQGIRADDLRRRFEALRRAGGS